MSIPTVQKQGRKRKADAQDSKASSNAALFDELGNDLSHITDGHVVDGLDGRQGRGGDLLDTLSLSEDSQDDDSDSEAGSGLEDEESDSDSVYSGDHARGITSNYTITKDANGNPRYIYREIEPGYDSDDSDAPAIQNTIGNIPLSFYESYPHLGYDIDGNKVMRPAKGAALDSLLDSIDIPKGWTGLTDPATGKPLTLNEEELDILKRLTRNEVVEDGYDPYPDMVEYFSGKIEPMPLNAAPEPKRRFVPSKHEAKRVMKLVKAIREGRIQPYKPPSDDEPESEFKSYDIWADEAPRPDHPMNMPAPKLPPPTYDESYHPPAEYLPDEDEKKEWLDTDPEDRDKDYLPTNHDSLRKVPGYDQFVKEKFERCLDLYLAPRVRRSKLNIDPESLLPKLPSPEELRPFPTRCDLVFSGHRGRVRSLAIDPCGRLLATGGDDGSVRIWTLREGREIYKVQLSNHEAVNVVSWRPGKELMVLAAAVGESVFLFASPIIGIMGQSSKSADASRELLSMGWQAGNNEASQQSLNSKATSAAQWLRPETRLQQQGVMVQVKVRSTVKVITWHRRGEYFATVSPQGQSSAIAIHTLSKHQTQLPFKKLKGLAQSAKFHPLKPIFFVATQRMIRSYDLVQQELVKVLQPGAKWISSFDVHPGGDNVIVGSFDKRLLWIDIDLSTRPYKTLRYHSKAIRSVKYHHGGYPLFADASDDGSIQVFHGKVVGDLMENANIVPLKVLRGHSVERGLGVLDLDWHPTEPYCVSAGADGTCRLWRP